MENTNPITIINVVAFADPRTNGNRAIGIAARAIKIFLFALLDENNI